MTHPCFDAVIAGGGPAGLAAAIALLERRLSVFILRPPAVHPTPRAEMLPPAAEPIIARLGIADVLEQAVALHPALGLWPTAQPEVLGHASAQQRTAISIDRYALITLMERRVKEKGGHFHPHRLRGIAGAPGNWLVATGDGQVVRARFAVDATGRPAHLARRLGAQLCLGATLVARTFFLPATPWPQLVIEATANGWWYALPMQQGGTAGFVSEADTLPEKPALLPIPGGFPPRAKTWDARNSRLSPCAGPGWLAAGDAAAAFDPVASQGLFNALSGGFFAGNAAADALAGEHHAFIVYADLVARTAVRTHRATPHHYATARGQSGFWHRRRAQAFSAQSERPTPSPFSEQGLVFQANFN
ncbi:NAD(P)/FAD-dependent oxidoreductase [uncultured Roseibium sp.]|uniref:NAD(P)/FAD-dependent oxidoreductase n=1 Tax=uncultured Roseibium sp. TaxID=1936171 RepID=UPI00261FEAD5|nr:lycopene cyclase family protein [uncultured Roseibium sp.]